MNTPEWERDAREYEEAWWKSLTEEEQDQLREDAREAYANENFDHPSMETEHPLDCACGSPFCSNYQPDNSCPW